MTSHEAAMVAFVVGAWFAFFTLVALGVVTGLLR
jgi:hypothetical protein